VAQFNPAQLDMFNSMINYAKTSPIAGMLQNNGANLAAAGGAGTVTGLEGLRDFRPTGTTLGTIADAGLYADNPFISGMVDAATRDAQRATYEGILPQNARNAALSGNANSSKRFISDAIAQRGLADRTADVSAALRGDAYSKGLDLSQNQSQFNDTAMLDRSKALSSLGIDAGSLGMNNLLGSVSTASDLFNIGSAGGAGLQAADQAKLDNEIAKQQAAWDNLINYYNIIGGGSWGGNVQSKSAGTQNTAGTSTASPAATIGGLLTAAGSLIPGKK
jgi:hypothetical protein